MSTRRNANVNTTVLILASADSLPVEIDVTHASVAPYVDDIEIVDESRHASALLLAKNPMVLTVMAGETVDSGSWPSLKSFAAREEGKGLIAIVKRMPDGRLVRSFETRVLRPGSLSGDGRPVRVPGFVIEAPARDKPHATEAEIAALEHGVELHPNDPSARRRLATALLDVNPIAAVEHANSLLSATPLDTIEGQAAALLLADALERAGMYSELIDLAEAGRNCWPRFTELRLREAIALEKQGRFLEMVKTLEECLALGEDVTSPGSVGAGTFLPLHYLGVYAASRGDKAAAKLLFEKALSYFPYGPTASQIRALFKVESTKDPTVPPTKAAEPKTTVSGLQPRPKATDKTRPLTIVACIPGREFSGRFFDAWNEFTEKCRAVGVNLIVSRRYDAVVYYARNKVAGGDVRRGAKQAPWGGEIDYDYMLWIDSDVIFRFEDFQSLLAHKVDMVAGLYLMADNARYAAVEHMDESTFKKQGEFEFLTPQKLASRRGLVKVDYCGFGFVLVRRGVFERLEYPWFRPVFVEMGECTDFTSEDVGFCMMAKRAGIPMMVDPSVVVGHEKAVVLAPESLKANGRRAA